MGQNILKSKVGKWGIGAVLVFIIIAGMLFIGRQPETTAPVRQEAVVMKIPKNPMPEKFKPVPPEQEEVGAPAVSMQNSGTVSEAPAIDPVAPEDDVAASAVFDSEMPVEVVDEEDDSADVKKDAAEPPGEIVSIKPFFQQKNDADAEQPAEKVIGETSQSDPATEELQEEPVKAPPMSEASKTTPAVPGKKNAVKPDQMVSRPQADLPKRVSTLVLHDIRLSENLKGKILEIWTNTRIEKYKYFILSNPPRLVIDLPGKWEAPRFQRKAMNDRLISAVRLWRHPEKLRIVSDLVSDKRTIKPVVTTNSEGMEFLLATE